MQRLSFCKERDVEDAVPYRLRGFKNATATAFLLF